MSRTDSDGPSQHVTPPSLPNSHALRGRALDGVRPGIMKLQRATAFRRFVMRRAVRQQAVEQQRAARFQRGRRAPLAQHRGIANLPVAAREMRHDLVMLAGQQLHAAVFHRGLVERDPHADDPRAARVIEIGQVLVPRFLASAPRRFEQRHVLEQHRIVTEQFLQGGEQRRVIRHRPQPRLVFDEHAELAHGVLALVERQRVQNVPRVGLEHDPLEIRISPLDQRQQPRQRVGGLARGERLRNREITNLVIKRNFLLRDRGEVGHLPRLGHGSVEFGRVHFPGRVVDGRGSGGGEHFHRSLIG